MKKTIVLAALLLSGLTFAQTKTKAKAKKNIKKEVVTTKTAVKTETTKKAEVIEAPKEETGLITKINNTAKKVEEKANLPIINENNTVKKIKEGAVKVKEVTNN